MEEREDESFNGIVTALGGWPVIDPRWDDSGFDLATLLANLQASSYGFTPLVLLFVSVDERNSVAHRILVTNNRVHTSFHVVIGLTMIVSHLTT